jgi:hypothetical protein
MQKAGVLLVDQEENELVANMRYYLRRGQHLTLLQLLALLEDRSILDHLGRYECEAERQLDEIGDAVGQVAPLFVRACMHDASTGKGQNQAEHIIAWLKSVIPADPVSHYFVASRLVLGYPAARRASGYKEVAQALLQIRKHESFNGWWFKKQNYGRNCTFYARPPTTYDL